VSDSGPVPLSGRRIAVTRAEESARDLAARLETLGAATIACPTIAIAPPVSWVPLDTALTRLAAYDWVVFTSANAVRAFSERLGVAGARCALPDALRIAAVGRATADATRSLLRAPDLVPREARAAGLVAALGATAGQRYLLPQSAIARPELAEGLRAAGATVETVTAYRTVAGAPAALGEIAELLHAGALDAVTLTRPSTVAGFLDGLAGVGVAPELLLRLPRRPALCCIGPTTAAATRARGLPVDAIADEPTDAGLITALIRCLAGRPLAGHEGERVRC
jgi:uroporphyrinogen-III synthase